MWTFLENVWGTVSDYAGDAYDSVSGYVEETYDDYFTDYSQDSMSNYFTTDRGSSTFSGVKTALDFAGGFLDIAAAPSEAGMPPSHRRRVSAPGSKAGGADYKAGKSNMASPEFGYTPRVAQAITKANSSKVPSIQAAVAQMMNYRGSGRATIKLERDKLPSVAARTKKPTFAPKYYG
tara:strand:+ start:13 stop:546 length:534 start_codon:yes stop_codon:yes gene_type:complete